MEYAKKAIQKYDMTPEEHPQVIIVIYCLYQRQLSTDIKTYIYKINTSFVRPEMPNVWANKTVS